MKNLTFIFLFSLLVFSTCYSQLPQEYPFKTLLDDQNNLLVTGYDDYNDFFAAKYPPAGTIHLWKKSFPNPGNDRGMDLVFDDNNNVYATGYIYNQTFNCNDIILIKYDGFDGDTLWTRKVSEGRDSKAFGIALDNDKNVYITGNITNKDNMKSDIITIKYNPAGVVQWSKTYNNPAWNSEDAGTHILVDNNFVYITGYTYQGIQNKNDVVILTYDQYDGSYSAPVQLFYDKGNQIPTSFIITELADISIPRAKSRMAVGCVSDNAVNNIPTDYLTLCFGGDDYNELRWHRKFNGAGNGEDVATAMAKDDDGNVFVTGYSYNGINRKFDFASMKYSKYNGDYLWNPEVSYFDFQNGDDKASSIKVGSLNDVYIAGESEFSDNGFKIAGYKQENSTIIRQWSDEFNPVLDIIKEDDITSLQKATKVDIDNQGNIFLTVFTWNSNGASYAIRKYDSFGNILFTIENTGNRPGNNLKSEKNSLQLKTKKQKMETKD